MSAELDLASYKDQLIEAYTEKIINLELLIKAQQEKEKIQSDIIKAQSDMIEHYTNVINTLNNVMRIKK